MSKPEELRIELSEHTQKQMESDPEMAAQIRELCAVLRQAQHAVDTGAYDTWEEAIEALTGHKPERADIDDVSEYVTADELGDFLRIETATKTKQ